MWLRSARRGVEYTSWLICVCFFFSPFFLFLISLSLTSTFEKKTLGPDQGHDPIKTVLLLLIPSIHRLLWVPLSQVLVECSRISTREESTKTPCRHAVQWWRKKKLSGWGARPPDWRRCKECPASEAGFETEEVHHKQYSLWVPTGKTSVIQASPLFLGLIAHPAPAPIASLLQHSTSKIYPSPINITLYEGKHQKKNSIT